MKQVHNSEILSEAESTALSKTKAVSAQLVHVVKDQDQNGNEVFALKTFKDTDEGLVMIKEMRFYQRQKLDAALEEKLKNTNVEIRQTIDSFQFDDGSEIKRTVKNGEIQDLRITSEKGILDCQKSEGIPSCECK